MKPVCIPCERFFRPVHNGYAFIEGMPNGQAAPGLAEPERWHPYKLWLGDKWECPDCHATIIVGVGWHPVAEHYQDDFAAQVDCFGAELLVKDC